MKIYSYNISKSRKVCVFYSSGNIKVLVLSLT